MKAGVLALQGDFREHEAVLTDLGATPIEVRTPEDFAGVDALMIPGGESTTISKLARSAGLVEPIVERARAGMPMLGTCAGMIVMAARVEGGEPLLALVDIGVRRNAYGRQIDSFEADLDVEGVEGSVRAVFIRAPVVEDVGDRVRVIAEHEGHPVVLEEANLVVASFHPELVREGALHRYVLDKA
ncbi:MAG TPA: pyridoxal 5'-phosphate synthase glutaminase subunit PdxT [Actinomycetota bacterium]|jgi:5'-phosphate synthase pdxT subunit|nr:pyridoxal 5'-phosphate synthase glutaminase subunit PdxT [Actinomycetota bacterium]